MGKLVIFSAPSGSGKTTIVRELLKRFPQFEFSISATSRLPRGKEQHARRVRRVGGGICWHLLRHT